MISPLPMDLPPELIYCVAAHTDPVTRVALCLVDKVVWCHFRPTRQDGITALVGAAAGCKLDYFQELLLTHLEPTAEEWKLVIEAAVKNKQDTMLHYMKQEGLLDYNCLIHYSDEPLAMTLCKSKSIKNGAKFMALCKAATEGNLDWFLELQSLTRMTRGMYEEIAVTACVSGQLVILMQLSGLVYDTWRPLQTACFRGHLNCVQYLIRDTDDITKCVELAITHRHKDVARWLLDNYTIDWEQLEFYVWAILLNLMWTNVDDIRWLHNLRWKDTYIFPSQLLRDYRGNSIHELHLNKCGTDVMHWLHEKNIIQDSNMGNFIRVAMLIGDLELLQFLQATYHLHWDMFIMYGRHCQAVEWGHEHIIAWLLTHFTVQDVFHGSIRVSGFATAWMLRHSPTMIEDKYFALSNFKSFHMWNEILLLLDTFPEMCCINIRPVLVYHLLWKLLQEQEFNVAEQVCINYNIIHNWKTLNKLAKLTLIRSNWPYRTETLVWICRHIPPKKRAKEVVSYLVNHAITRMDTRLLKEFSNKKDVWPLVKDGNTAYLKQWCQQPDFFWDS